MKLTEDEYLAHYGILRRSGRYPWGSGEDQPARNRMFVDTVEDLKKQGMTDDEIRRGFSSDEYPISTTRWRAAKSIAKNQIKAAQIAQAERLRAKGMGNTAAAEQMSIPESSYRALLAPGAKDRVDVLSNTAQMLRDEVAEKKYVDVGAGVESYIGSIGISKERLNTAVAMLEEEGYAVHPVKFPQAGTGKDTEMKVLSPPGTTFGDAQRNKNNVQQIRAVTNDYGQTWSSGKVHDPIAINPKRVGVRYKEDGGDKTDGVIYVRPGVPDISLGKSQYAQVRVKVGNDHFLKGMAMYKDDLPEGTDLLFNTSKSDTGNKFDAFKKLTDSKEYPFKTVVRQQLENEGTPKERVTSAMNIVFEEGNWKNWRKALSSQVLSKQSTTLAKSQLGVAFDRTKQDFDGIMSLTNPTIKKKLLEEFAKQTDSSAVHLHAAALNSRQRWHVILPIESMKPTEVYAPNYNDGERVVLIRHPHAGPFEIPELTVNNKNPEARKSLGNNPDAIGIHHSVAQHLSGADFDGDSVIVIPNPPNSRKRIKTLPMLEGLKDFDPHTLYKKYDGMEVISPDQKQREMGKISNLITDMTIRQASHEELTNAIKHSMVVIDAEKHELNYKQSAIDNRIAALKAKYQTGGASTLISRAKSPVWVPHRKPRLQSEGGPVDPITGKKQWVETGLTTVNRRGQVIPKMTRTTRLAEADNAHALSSGTIMEGVYADHSNALKGLANKARLVALNTPLLERSDSARKVYADEVKTLTSKVVLAKRNAPLERQAQLIARASVRAKRDAEPELEGDALKKIHYQELAKARERVGAKKKLVEITDREWDAIQAGAISNSQLITILNNTDIDKLKARATPRSDRKMTSSMKARAQGMLGSGYTRAQVAQQLGVSLTTLDNTFKEQE